ncbi:hypothetical protein T4A_6941 [Trichinella pseudospiralis]|uniref:Uncharacterized protein n=1 Tax=Trichinella pseudospiralis TaxID=6337 RepID=A0A0V1DT46_TRIPS|nr:hypothetical protein T4A_5284 [Trichinella pseudospiralis]KRY64752.1 hypothetical protein T4A_2924 [Trichinella pseudospiralis]KRY72793.1 hypothetical protein T4A_6941 [Trichinella pseudospiralis]
MNIADGILQRRALLLYEYLPAKSALITTLR